MVSLAERVFWMIVWVLLILVLAGFLLHLMNEHGIFPGVANWVATKATPSAAIGG
jgi:hypothetical protein